MLRRKVRAFLILQLFSCLCCEAIYAQSVQEVLSQCRDTYEKISSYEFLAISSHGDRTKQKLYFIARDGDACRYDQAGWLTDPGDVSKYSFDGLYYFEQEQSKIVERLYSPPAKSSLVKDPFQQCFYWLTNTGSRSELLKKSRWDLFAKSCDDVVSAERVLGFECSIVTSSPVAEGWRFEVAFANELGFLPVRIRRLVGKEKKMVWEESFMDFQRFNVNGESIHFPTTFITRVTRGEAEIMEMTKIKPGTLYINTPIPIGLFRLEQDSAKFNVTKDSGSNQEWFHIEVAGQAKR